MTEAPIYKLSFNKPSGEEVKMSSYKGKAILVVNTATQCGLTSQFSSLEKLHQKYEPEGLIVLGFPCNQFMGQEPVSNEEMVEICQINHGVTFPLTEKIRVNGPGTHPIFKYLKKKLGGRITNMIKWNFTKFLIDREGNPVKRYTPTTDPMDIEKDIQSVIAIPVD